MEPLNPRAQRRAHRDQAKEQARADALAAHLDEQVNDSSSEDAFSDEDDTVAHTGPGLAPLPRGRNDHNDHQDHPDTADEVNIPRSNRLPRSNISYTYFRKAASTAEIFRT